MGRRCALTILAASANSQSPDGYDTLLLGGLHGAAGRCVCRPKQIGPFLKVHAEAYLACIDASRLHWAIHHHLRANDQQALPQLWAFSEFGRLYDVCLLDQLVRLAEAGDCRAE